MNEDEILAKNWADEWDKLPDAPDFEPDIQEAMGCKCEHDEDPECVCGCHVVGCPCVARYRARIEHGADAWADRMDEAQDALASISDKVRNTYVGPVAMRPDGTNSCAVCGFSVHSHECPNQWGFIERNLHGYTCDLCSWGRDRNRSVGEYAVHLRKEHCPPNEDTCVPAYDWCRKHDSRWDLSNPKCDK